MKEEMVKERSSFFVLTPNPPPQNTLLFSKFLVRLSMGCPPNIHGHIHKYTFQTEINHQTNFFTRNLPFAHLDTEKKKKKHGLYFACKLHIRSSRDYTP